MVTRGFAGDAVMLDLRSCTYCFHARSECDGSAFVEEVMTNEEKEKDGDPRLCW